MEHGDAERASAPPCRSFLSAKNPFIENHDEPRAAATVPDGKGRCGSGGLTLPGAKLLHEGQFDGMKLDCLFLGLATG
jgi:hypothetical protein